MDKELSVLFFLTHGVETTTTTTTLHQFNGLFSGQPVSWYQKGKPMRQEMMGFWDAVASAGQYANKLHLAPDR